MAKKSKPKKKEDEKHQHQKPYKGPFQDNPYEKIDSAKRVMKLTNQTPTKEVISPISETDDPFADEEELSKQIIEERKSPTERKRMFLKIGYYFMLSLGVAGIIGAITLFFNHGIRINLNEVEIEKTNKIIYEEIKPEVKVNREDIQTIKSDNRLYEYRLKQVEDKNNSVPNNKQTQLHE